MNHHSKHYTIKEWAEEDRPREKLLKKGKESLSNAELLAIIIGSGSKEESAVDLCKRVLMDSSNSLLNLGKYDVADLKRYRGIGEAKAISIIAALELGRRRKNTHKVELPKFEASRDIYEFICGSLEDLRVEEFWILLLNRANRLIAKKLISKGGTSSTVVDVKLVFKYALENLSSAIVLIHNHPSGNLKPSVSDLNITKKMVEAGKLMDIKILDHLIISDKGYLSFLDEGLL